MAQKVFAAVACTRCRAARRSTPGSRPSRRSARALPRRAQASLRETSGQAPKPMRCPLPANRHLSLHHLAPVVGAGLWLGLANRRVSQPRLGRHGAFRGDTAPACVDWYPRPALDATASGGRLETKNPAISGVLGASRDGMKHLGIVMWWPGRDPNSENRLLISMCIRNVTLRRYPHANPSMQATISKTSPQ